MKQKDVFKKIGGIIQELSDQYDYLQTLPDDLNDLELELFAANAHFLTDHIEILCKLNLQNVPAFRPLDKHEPTTYEQKFFEPVVQHIKPDAAKPEERKQVKPAKPEVKIEKPVEAPSAPAIDLTVDAPEDSYSFIRSEAEPVVHEFVLNQSSAPQAAENVIDNAGEKQSEIEEAEVVEDPEEKETPAEVIAAKEPETEEIVIEPFAEQQEPEPVLAEAPEKTEPIAEPIVVDGPVKAEAPVEPVAEIIPEKKEIPAEAPVPKAPEKKDDAEEVVTVNQKISARLAEKPAPQADQLSNMPISDIKLAITLNDKLLYVKDLFNGYNLAYSEAIEILNRFSTFEEASRFLNTNYVTKNNWESKPETTRKFYAQIKRRYA